MNDLSSFHEAAERLFAALDAAMETLAAETDADLDWQWRDDVFTIDADGVQWVINAHTPRREIWFAGRGEAHHFQRDANGTWRDTRSGNAFAGVLAAALRDVGIGTLPSLPKECGAR